MTGPEHYREAERILAAQPASLERAAPIAYACAQVHATLALAAATAFNHGGGEGLHSHEWEAWDDAAGTKRTLTPQQPPEVTS